MFSVHFQSNLLDPTTSNINPNMNMSQPVVLCSPLTIEISIAIPPAVTLTVAINWTKKTVIWVIPMLPLVCLYNLPAVLKRKEFMVSCRYRRSP